MSASIPDQQYFSSLPSDPHAAADSLQQDQDLQASLQVCHICCQRRENNTLLGVKLKLVCSCSDLQTITSSGSSLQTVACTPVIELVLHFR